MTEATGIEKTAVKKVPLRFLVCPQYCLIVSLPSMAPAEVLAVNLNLPFKAIILCISANSRVSVRHQQTEERWPNVHNARNYITNRYCTRDKNGFMMSDE